MLCYKFYILNINIINQSFSFFKFHFRFTLLNYWDKRNVFCENIPNYVLLLSLVDKLIDWLVFNANFSSISLSLVERTT